MIHDSARISSLELFSKFVYDSFLPVFHGKPAKSQPLLLLCYNLTNYKYMIYKITQIEDDFLEKIYKESVSDLNTFYEIGWNHHLPKLVVVDDRKTIDSLRDEKTEGWLIGWSRGEIIYVLNKDNFEKESNHKYSPDTYSAFIKHELSHSFFNVLSGYNSKPIWLNDGLSIYTSNQDKLKKKPEAFSKFLEFYDNGGKDLYAEPGFFVRGLIEKFGKKKLLNLIKGLKNARTKEDFEKLFAKEYGFNLNYEEINAQKLI